MAQRARKYRKYSKDDKALFFEAKERLGTAVAAARELGFNRSTCLMWTNENSRSPGTEYAPEQKADFFALLDHHNSVSAAARQLGINTQTAFHWAYSTGAVQRKPQGKLTARQLALEPKKAQFLAVVERVGNISVAAREVGVKGTQGESWARAAGVENTLQSRGEKQAQYTRLRAEGATQKAATAAVGVNRRTGYNWDQAARPATAQAEEEQGAEVAYNGEVTTTFAHPGTTIKAATEAFDAPVPALMPEPATAPQEVLASTMALEPSAGQLDAPQQLVVSAPEPVSIEGLVQILDSPYLSQREREMIADLLHADQKIRAIARELGRSASSISREIKRNSHPRLGYQPYGAQRAATAARARPKPSKLAEIGELREYVETKLLTRWSPEQISNLLIKEFPDDPQMRVSHETIYQALYIQARGGLKREVQNALRTGRTRRKKHKGPEERRSRFRDPMVNISERPAEVEDRAIPGHWEGDLVRHEALFYRAEVEDLRLCAVAAA